MIRSFRNNILVLLLLILWVVKGYAQQNNHKAIPSISEIIFPATAQTKDNFNLMYEVHLSRNEIPTPSFWYKIIFNTDCEFEFTLFPLQEENRYEFFMYKIEGNESFCKALSANRVITLNHYKYIKKFNDTYQSKKFRDNLVNVKPIPVKAGDAIYLEVIAVKGKDCGHMLDCRTSVSSMVIKTINDNCSSITPLDSLKDFANDRKEAVALKYLSDELCLNVKKAIKITAIDLKGDKLKAKNINNYNAYAKKEAVKYKKYQPKKDTVVEEQKVVQDSVVLPVKTKVVKVNTHKTTAELNSQTTINAHQTAYQTKGGNNITRFKVDRVMFNLLLNKLNENKVNVKQELRNKYAEMKKISKKNKKKRKQELAKLKVIKTRKKAVEKEIASVKIKLQKINKLIAKGSNNTNEDFVFDGNISYASNNNNDFEKITKVGLVYKVQIGVYKNKISKEIFKGLSPVFEDVYKGGVRYSVGAFRKLLYVKQAKKYVVELGLKDAFVVAYYNGERIAIGKALKME